MNVTEGSPAPTTPTSLTTSTDFSPDFEPVTRTEIHSSSRSAVRVSSRSVAPGITLPKLNHCTAVVTPDGAQVPGFTVRVWPTLAVPVTVGAPALIVGAVPSWTV